MKIDILVGDNLYGSTVNFAKGLASALKKEGIDVRLFWVGEGYFFQAFYEILADPPDYTCSFSDIKLGNLPLAELWSIPHISLLVDPAIYFLHHCTSSRSFIGSVDEEDVTFLKQLGFPRAFFFPHAAHKDDFTSTDLPREYEEVFFGTCVDIDALLKSWEKKYSAKEREVLQEASRLTLSSGEISVLKALRQLNVTDETLPLFHYEVDQYCRGKDRIELLKNRKVHIWGSGPWEKYCPHAFQHSQIPFQECLEIMKRSRFVLNSSPRFKQGSHERIFNALMCGACPVTMENGFTSKFFAQGELITYKVGDWNFAMDPKEATEIAHRGQVKVLHEHSWEARSRLLLQSLGNHMNSG